MADAPIVHIGENSPEQVAYKLLQHIANVEGRSLNSSDPGGGKHAASRAWILQTMADCMAAVKGSRLSLDYIEEARRL